MNRFGVGLLVYEWSDNQEKSDHTLSSMLYALKRINESAARKAQKFEAEIFQSQDLLSFKYDIEKTLNDPDISALVISVPSHFRREVAALCAMQEKPVFYTDFFEGLADEKNLFYTAATLDQRIAHLKSWVKQGNYKRVLIVSDQTLRSKVADMLTRNAFATIPNLEVHSCYADKKLFDQNYFRQQVSGVQPDLICSLLEEEAHEQMLYTYFDDKHLIEAIISLFVSVDLFQSIKIAHLKQYLVLEEQNDFYSNSGAFRAIYHCKAWSELQNPIAALAQKEMTYRCEKAQIKVDCHGYSEVETYIYKYENQALSEVSKERRAPMPWLGVEKLSKSKQQLLMPLLADYPNYYQTLKELGKIANYDALTMLYNRERFIAALNHALSLSKRHDLKFALLLFDLDNFKKINEAFGLAFGDQLLKVVGERIKKSLRETDVFARLGGDEFAILVENMQNRYDIITLTEKLLALFSQAFVVQNQKIYMTASFGITRFPYDGKSAEQLIKNADSAMYEAKAEGRDGYSFFLQKDATFNRERLILENDLHDACHENQLELFFQPQVLSTDKSLVGAEALIRWNHPKRGLLEPIDFLPIAEDAGLMHKIDLWVLKNVFNRIDQWMQAKQKIVPIAVNISNALFNHKNFMPSLEALHLRYPKVASHIDLELTENIMIKDPAETLKKVLKMKAFGFTISIDDFGTGYSSLSHLKNLPIGKLKIDRSFIKDIDDNNNDEAIVKAIVAMAQSLDMNVIAEGVDKDSQVDILKSHECHQIQGFIYSKPLSLAAFSEAWLKH